MLFPDDANYHSAMVLVNREAVNNAINISTNFFLDGTFRITPRQGKILNVRSAQVLNLIADYNGHAVLLFTVIMTSRRLALYEKVMDIIKNHFPDFNPTNMMADYEQAMRKAFRSRFPASRLLGCR